MLTFFVFITHNYLLVILLFLFCLFSVIAAKLPLKIVWQSIKFYVLGFGLGFVLLFSIILWDLRQGFFEGIIFAIKFLVIILSTIVFSMSTSPRDIISSLSKMKIPYAFAFMLALAIRFVPVINKEFNQVVQAQKARAYKISFSLKQPIQTVKSFIPVLIPVFMLLFKKSLDIALSIESRGFDSEKKRSQNPRLKLKMIDYAAIAFIVALFLAYLIIKYLY